MTNILNEEFNLIVFGKIPKHEDLCCIVATIYANSRHEERLPNTDFHWQIFKCRHLIYSLPEVIASPVFETIRQIYIIINIDYYETGKLQEYLKQQNVELDDPIPVSNDIYESCLRYTIYARLAPNWNQVDKYLIQGREFLMVTCPSNAIRFNIIINESEMYIVIWALRIRLPHFPLEDFDHPAGSKPLSNDFVWDLSSTSHWIHVLPSLKRGRVMSVSGRIPETSVFKSYKQLRRHWKNMYGYRLPENEEGMIYTTISFGGGFMTHLTYPLICVRACRPIFYRQQDQHLVLYQLIEDLNIKIPYICGFPFGIESHIRYAIPKLSASKEITGFENLSSTPPNLYNRNIRQEQVNENDYNMKSQLSLCTPSQAAPHTQQASFNNTITGFENMSSTPPNLYNRNIRHEQVNENDYNMKSQLSLCTPSQAAPHTQQASFNNTVGTRILSSQERREVLANRPHSPPPFIPTVPRFISNNQPLQTKFIPIFAPHPKKRTAFLRQTSAVADGPNVFNHSVQKNISQMSVIRSPKSSNHLGSPSAFQSSLIPADNDAKVVKKPRSRPQLQPELDIAKLAQGRQAEKEGLQLANTTTLIAFLRSQGIPCKVKDKKADLISKVLTHLNIPQPSSTQQQQQQQPQTTDT